MKYKFASVGSMNLKIVCADLVGLLNSINKSTIVLRNVKYVNDLEIFATISCSDYLKIRDITDKMGASVKIIRKNDFAYAIKNVLNRPVIMILFFSLLLINIFLPNFVLFLSVEGNKTIPHKKILETAAKCGISFGALRREIRSERMKNELLERLPELKWAGINTSGCTATISVKEKIDNNKTNLPYSVGSIVATHDGIIQNITVLQGNPLCHLGQAVLKGQTLVSGYTDCGILTKAAKANAEIIALTSRHIDIVSPEITYSKGEVVSIEKEYCLQIGKKIINFSKDSGILGGTCDKIYLKKYWYLPGGFRLPICLIQKTTTTYSSEPYNVQTVQDNSWLLEFAQGYLKSTMIAGDIISSDTTIDLSNGALYLKGSFLCKEMIGQFKNEQMIIKDEQND